jgi:dCMP deaminase
VKSGKRLDLCRAVHAEANCFLMAARHGIALADGTLYTTNTPCNLCAPMVINAGIIRVVALMPYESNALELFDMANVGMDLLTHGTLVSAKDSEHGTSR